MTDNFSDPRPNTIQNQSRIFCEIGQILTSSFNPKEIFNRAMELVGKYFAPQNWSLLLIEEETGRMMYEIVMGDDSGKLKDVYLKKNEGFAGWVCRNRQPLIADDVQKDPRIRHQIFDIIGFTIRSVVCVPLINGNNRVIGALEMINKNPPPHSETDKAFTVPDMEILSAIGAFIGIAAENAFLHQKVRDLSMIDPLTGVYNRHYFNEVLKRERDRVERDYYSICILMMDIDNIKRINDHYGHLSGDRVICNIANILKVTIRESDVLARYGGDEFIILMPNAKTDEGEKLAERIKWLIMDWNQQIPETDPMLGLSVRIYASGSDDLSKIFRNADRELDLTQYFQKKHEDIINTDQICRYLRKNLAPEEN